MEWNEYRGSWVGTEGDKILALAVKEEDYPCQAWNLETYFTTPLFISPQAAMEKAEELRAKFKDDPPTDPLVDAISSAAKGIIAQMEAKPISDQPTK